MLNNVKETVYQCICVQPTRYSDFVAQISNWFLIMYQTSSWDYCGSVVGESVTVMSYQSIYKVIIDF